MFWGRVVCHVRVEPQEQAHVTPRQPLKHFQHQPVGTHLVEEQRIDQEPAVVKYESSQRKCQQCLSSEAVGPGTQEQGEHYGRYSFDEVCQGFHVGKYLYKEMSTT